MKKKRESVAIDTIQKIYLHNENIDHVQFNEHLIWGILEWQIISSYSNPHVTQGVATI